METLTVKVMVFILFVFSAILHEFAHGLVAYHNGDDTAYLMGRLTLNPIAHLDPFGSIILPFLLMISPLHVAFGYMKPVPINPLRFKDYGRGMFSVGIAGCATNFGLGVIASLLGRFSSGTVQQILIFTAYINFLLCFFNLIPIPPLDGSRVLSVILPAKWAAGFSRIERFGLIFVYIFVFYIGFQILAPFCSFLVSHIAGLAHPIY